MGSTFDARIAGMRQAATATPTRSIETDPNTARSLVPTPWSRLEIDSSRAKDEPKPTMTPIP